MQALQIIHKKKKKKAYSSRYEREREREPKSQSTISLKLIKPTKELLSYEKDKIMVLSPKTNKVNRHFLLYLFFFFLEYSSLFYC